MIHFLPASWPAAEHIVAGITTREAGFSQFPYDRFNLATHVGDDINAVNKNRVLLTAQLNLPEQQQWLNQVHGSTIITACTSKNNCADATISFDKNKVCIVLTADCLPVLVCDYEGTCVAAIHAGWRGLRDGIIEKTILSLNCKPQDCMVWFGPAISSSVFEIDDKVRNEFINLDRSSDSAFSATRCGHWNMDLVQLASQRVKNIGVNQKAIYGGDQCSYLNNELFYSYRRNKITGRMASLIYIRDKNQKL